MASRGHITAGEPSLAEIERSAGEAFAWVPEDAPATTFSFMPLAWLAAGCAAAALYAVL